MPKRFSGEVKLTVSKIKNSNDEYNVKLKTPGWSARESVQTLMDGYTQLHGEETAMDEAAMKYLCFVQEHEPHLVAKAAKDGDTFHIGRDKANRWLGGPSNLKTKKGR